MLVMLLRGESMLRVWMVSAVLVASLSAEAWAAPKAKAQAGRGRAIDLISQGQQLEQSGDRQTAFQRYLESVQTAPSPAGYYNLGRLSRISGDKATAKRYLDEALKLNPDYELAKMELLQVNRGGSTRTETVSAGVVPGTIETAVNADGPINVDKLRREYITLQSIKKPAVLNDPDVVVAQGTTPEPSTPAGTAPAPGYAREAAIPQQPTFIENETNPKIIDNGLGRPDGQAVIEPIEEVPPRGQAIVTDREAVGSLSAGENTTVAAASDANSGSVTEVNRAVNTTADEAGGSQLEKVSRDDINEAAFGPESQQSPGSKGYHQGRKVALGTFPFHREKGDSYRAAQRWREAAIEYETALRLNPGDVETRTLLAEVTGRHGSHTAAQEEFERAKAQDPTDSRTWYKQGNAFYDQQKFDQAIGAYRRAIDLEPSNKFAHNNLGVVYMEKKDYSKAISSFKRVLDLDPNYDMAVLNLGIIYDEGMADPAEARKYYQRYIDLKGPRATEVQQWMDALPAGQ